MAHHIRLKTNDNEIFEVRFEVARMSHTLRMLLDDLGLDETDRRPVPIANVNATTMRRVVDWCEQHVHDPQPPPPVSDTESDGAAHTESRPLEAVPAWDADFLRPLEQSDLFELIQAANYLDIKGLFDVACLTVANMIRGRSVEDLRKRFAIKNDFTPDEEEQMRRESEWCQDHVGRKE